MRAAQLVAQAVVLNRTFSNLILQNFAERVVMLYVLNHRIEAQILIGWDARGAHFFYDGLGLKIMFFNDLS